MRILLTAGPTQEPIDAVRYIGNRSSGRMGAALAEAAMRAGHSVTLIAGPTAITMPPAQRRSDVRTAAEMFDAVMREFPGHDVLLMAAAVADFRVRDPRSDKRPRAGNLSLELEPTPDIVAAAAAAKRPDQRVIGFSLEVDGDVERAARKLAAKRLDMIVCNPLATIGSEDIDATILHADGRREKLGMKSKRELAEAIVTRMEEEFGHRWKSDVHR